MTCRLRQILPPTVFVTLFVVIYTVFVVLSRLLPPLDKGLNQEMASQAVTVALLGCGLYGAYRAAALHPVAHKGYAQWLRSTPWTSEVPLPLGPIHLIWADAVVLLPLVYAGMRQSSPFFARPLLAFFIPYLFVLAMELLSTEQPRFAWAILMGLGAAMLPTAETLRLSVCVILYLIAWMAVERSLQYFPWKSKLPTEATREIKTALSCWPYSRLQPYEIKPAIGLATGAAVGLLFAWYLFVFSTHLPPQDARDLLRVFSSLAIFGAPLVRILIYVMGHIPPISLVGRLLTRRWITPGYDYIFIAPAASCIVGLLLPKLLIPLGIPHTGSLCLSAGVVVALVLVLPPTLANWRLTGTHRLVAASGGNNSTLTQI